MKVRGYIILLLTGLMFQSTSGSSATVMQDTLLVNSYIKKAKALLIKHSKDSAELYLKRAGNLSKQLNYTSGQFNYLFTYSILLSGQKRDAEAVNFANQLLAAASKMKSKFWMAEAHYALAAQQMGSQKWNLAVNSVFTALKLSDGLDNKRQKANYYHALSSIFFELRESKKMLFYSKKSYELSQTLNDSVLLIKNLQRMSLHEMMNDQTDMALVHLRETESIFKARNQLKELAQTYLYFGHVYFRIGEYEKAQLYHFKVLSLVPEVADSEETRLHTECAIAETYVKMKSYKEAKIYYERNLKAAVAIMDVNDVKEMYRIGSEIYENLGQPLSALAYFKKYRLFSDSANNMAIRKSVHDTEIKYQTTLKEKSISEQKLQLSKKNYELQQKNKYILYAIIVIILLAFIAVITYLIHRNKNQSIELNLLKAQIHPHFLFNTLNNLYALSISKSDEAPHVVLGLSNILKYILYECNTPGVDLQKELAVIEDYIALEKVRFNQRLEVNFNKEGDFTQQQVAPLLLLPLVENAFKHGAGKLTEDAWINIDASVKGKTFVFKIANNKPESKDKALGPSKYGNIGVLNIRKRLNILYPKRHKLKITNSEDVFLVTLELQV